MRRTNARDGGFAVSLALLLAIAVAAVAGPDDLPSDVVSREIVVFNKRPDRDAYTDLVSREITLFNKRPDREDYSDVVSREVALFNKRPNREDYADVVSREITLLSFQEEVVRMDDVVSREITLFNKRPDRDTHTDVLSREITLFNKRPDREDYSDVISREIVLFNKRPDREDYSDVVSREIVLFNKRPDRDLTLDVVSREIVLYSGEIPELVVFSTSDSDDANPGDGRCDDGTGVCTLRAAISEAIALGGGFDIVFQASDTTAVIRVDDTYAITAPLRLVAETRLDGTSSLYLDGSSLASSEDGIRINASAVTVSGFRIGGFPGDAVEISGNDNRIAGCVIGVDPTGAEARNAGSGIRINGSSNTIGGIDSGDANLIANNDEHGIVVVGGARNTLRGNRIVGNAGRPIALGDGETAANDSLDTDNGPNGLINYPVVDSWHRTGDRIAVRGHVQSTPGASFTVDLYGGADCDAEIAADPATIDAVTTDGFGRGEFIAALPVGTPVDGLSGTSTDELGNTSELGPCRVPAVAAGVSLDYPAGDGTIPGLAYVLLGLPVDQGASNRRLSAVLEDLGRPSRSWVGYGWSPTAGYVENPIVHSGESYMVVLREPSSATVTGLDIQYPRAIDLQPGRWNFISVPGPAIDWGDCVVVDSTGISIPFGSVAADALLEPLVYWYDDETSDGVTDDAWRRAIPNATTGAWEIPDSVSVRTDANPWGGYLVWPHRACVLVVPDRATRSGRMAARAATPPVADIAWSLSLTVDASERTSGPRSLGVYRGKHAPRSSRIPKPSAPDTPLELAIRDSPGGRWDRVLERETDEDRAWPVSISGNPGATALRWNVSGEVDGHVYLIDLENDRAIDVLGTANYTFAIRESRERTFVVLATQDAWQGELFSPVATALLAPWPNPSSGQARGRFHLEGPTRVRLEVFDVSGRRVRRLVDDVLDPGRYEVAWDGDTDHGVRVGAGIYFLRLDAGRQAFVRKITMLR